MLVSAETAVFITPTYAGKAAAGKRQVLLNTGIRIIL